MTNSVLDIVTPVYNEGKNILDMLRAFERCVKTPIRVLVCYDFDEDNTLAAIRNARFPFEIIPVKNRGTGVHGAIVTGFEESRAPAVLVFPADEAYNASVIDPMVVAFQTSSDLVVASRFMRGGEMRGGPVLKSWIVRAASFLLRWMARLPVRDATYGLRLQSKKLLDTVRIESTEGWTYAIELLVKCHRLGWKIAEVPARWYQREKGTSRFRLRRWLPLYGRWFFYAFATTYLRKGPETVIRKIDARI
jgi:dolichol-phosphate mannosyltransferase